MFSKKLLLLLFLISLVSSGFAQTHSMDFVYELVWKEDSLNLHKTKKEDMLLQVKGEESCFQSMGNHNWEGRFEDFEKLMKTRSGITGDMILKLDPVFAYRIFKDKKALKGEERIMRKHYEYALSFDSDAWHIQTEQDSIAGFWSQRATVDYNGRSYVAWFTTELPVQDGPYVFYGLPGLIVKLYDTEEHYTFTLREVNKANSVYPPKTKNGIVSSFEEISRIKRKLRQDPATDTLISDFFGSEGLENTRKLAARNNNPLERNQ